MIIKNKVVHIALYIKQGKVIPKIGDKINTTLDNGVSCQVIALGIEDVEWTDRLMLKVSYKVKVLEVEEKHACNNKFFIVK